MRTVSPLLRALLVASGAMALTAAACATSERHFLGDTPPDPGARRSGREPAAAALVPGVSLLGAT